MLQSLETFWNSYWLSKQLNSGELDPFWSYCPYGWILFLRKQTLRKERKEENIKSTIKKSSLFFLKKKKGLPVTKIGLKLLNIDILHFFSV
jgi:hypothetical protein